MAFAVVLDANVLYPIALTDFFLTLAGYGLYRPHWSTEILREAGRNLLEKNPNINEDQLEYRFGEMNRAHPGALANPPPELIPVMTNDPKDRHVLAAAITSHASVIATFNTKHFLPEACEPHGVEAQHPDVFAEHLVDLDPAAAARALEEMSGRTQNPHREVQEIVARLGEDLPKAMGRLEQLGGHAPAP
jgi:predicted nucleic acid-binding protein